MDQEATTPTDSDYQNISPNMLKSPVLKDFPEEDVVKSPKEPHEPQLLRDEVKTPVLLSGTAWKVGVAGLGFLLASNYYLFRPYFTALLFSWVVSVPLHGLKSSIHGFLVEGLKDRPKETAFNFVSYHILYMSSQILFGKVITEWGFGCLDSILYPFAVESKETLKLRPIEKDTSVLETKSEKDPFQDLKTKDTPPPSPRESPSTKQHLGNIDTLLQRPDWYYIMIVIRCCAALSILSTLKELAGPIIFLAILGGAGMFFSGVIKGLAPQTLKKVLYPSELIFGRVRLFLSGWIYDNSEDAAVMFLVFGVVFGMIFSGFTLISSIISEFQGGVLSYAGSLFRVLLSRGQSLLVDLANEAEHLSPMCKHGDVFLKGQLNSTMTVKEAAQYLMSPEFFEVLATQAPSTWGLLQGSIKGEAASQIPQEIQSLSQNIFPNANTLVSQTVGEYAPVIAAPVLTLVSAVTSNLALNVVLPYFLLALDTVFQIVVFTLTLWSLVSRKASPLQPAQALFSNAWDQENKSCEERFFGHINALISGVCLSTFQMGLFHTLFSWLTLRLFGAPGACLFALTSGLIAVIPLGGPYIAILPSVQFMWFIEGRRLIPLALFICHLVTATMVDGAFYAHLPSVSSFYTALAAFLGYSVLGLQGLFFGPFILALVPILYSEFLVSQTPDT